MVREIPIADIQVQAIASGPSGGVVDTTTNPDGLYVIEGLTNVGFRLSFYDGSGEYQNGFRGATGLVIDPADAAPVVAGGNPVGVDVVLPAEPDPLPTIRGLVLDNLGIPVEGVQVSAFSTDFPMQCGTTTAADGTYEITDLRVGRYFVYLTSDVQPNGYYAVAFPSNFVTHPSEATVVTVAANVIGINIKFPATFSISGEVDNTLGDPVGGIDLSACEVIEGGLCSFVTSEPDGSYSISRLVAGSYIIQQGDPTLTYQSGYHVDGPAGVVADRSAATQVAAGATDVVLLAVPNPRITGTITDPAFVPLEGIDVSACSLPDSEVCGSATTAANGTFAVSVDPGTYALRVSDPNGEHPDGYVGSGPVLVLSQDDADPVPVLVGGGDVAIGSFAFADGARIGGLTISGGNPLPYAGFDICSSEFACVTSAQSDDGGIFLSRAVPSGEYHLASYTDIGAVWYVDGSAATADFASSTAITVGTTDVAGIVFDIPPVTTGTPTTDGPDVEVTPTDPATGATPVTLKFDFVNFSGETFLTVSDIGAGTPAGFQLGVPATYFDISTTADFEGHEVEICISYAGVSFPDESHCAYSTTTRTPIHGRTRRPPRTSTNDVICGRTDSFSPFAIFQRVMTFTGFEPPIADLPAVNRATAAEAVKVIFGLGGDFGPAVLAAGSPASQRTDCTTGAPIGPVELTASTDKKVTLRYDKKAQTYTYNWKTVRAWDGTCRQLILTFSDGSTAEAAFDFRPAPRPPKPAKPAH